MNVFLTSLGCRLNDAEVESWARTFERGGHAVVAAPERANVVVVNTCAVTSQAARKSRKLVGALHRRNPEAHVVVTGCFAELEPATAAGLAGVDLVVPNRDKDRLPDVAIFWALLIGAVLSKKAAILGSRSSPYSTRRRSRR